MTAEVDTLQPGAETRPSAGPLVCAAVMWLVPGMLFVPGRAVAAGTQDPTIQSHCRLQPRTLNVSRSPGPLVGRVEFFSADGLTAITPTDLAPGVYISSVAGMRLPAPGEQAEGIDESPAARLFEDREDVRGRGTIPNGVPEAVVHFTRPCDGKSGTRDDGNSGDVLAMLMDVPDGQTAEVCIAGRIAGTGFECCDAIRVINRGLRDLPRGLTPRADSGRP